MKILHCCFAGLFVEGFGYQENILSRIHAHMGHEVQVVTSTEIIDRSGARSFVEPGVFRTSDGIVFTRLKYRLPLPKWVNSKLRYYEGLGRVLNSFRPDLLFVHDSQFFNAFELTRYAKSNSVRLVVDCHADYINSARGFISRRILHGILYRACARSLDQVAEVFLATLPMRSTFLQDCYGIQANRITFLPFGIDDSRFDIRTMRDAGSAIRRSLGIANKDVVFVTGGKIDKLKNIDQVAKAFIERKKRGDLPTAKLIIFGEPTEELKLEFESFRTEPGIHLLGWQSEQNVYNYLSAADCVVLPGTHSVLWEASLGLGVPAVFRFWPGMGHLDWGGNCRILPDPNTESLGELMVELCNSPRTLKSMKRAANMSERERFTYTRIAEAALSGGFAF